MDECKILLSNISLHNITEDTWIWDLNSNRISVKEDYELKSNLKDVGISL